MRSPNSQRALEASEAALHTAQVLAERRAGRALFLAIRLLGHRNQRNQRNRLTPPADGVAVQALQAELRTTDGLLAAGSPVMATTTTGPGSVDICEDQIKLAGGRGARWFCTVGAALLLGMATGLALGIAAGHTHTRRRLPFR